MCLNEIVCPHKNKKLIENGGSYREFGVLTMGFLLFISYSLHSLQIKCKKEYEMVCVLY